MKGWFKDNGKVSSVPCETVREGPWEIAGNHLYGQNVKDLRCTTDAHGSIVWAVTIEMGNSQQLQRIYWWDWEGDAGLALREAIMAAEYAEVAS